MLGSIGVKKAFAGPSLARTLFRAAGCAMPTVSSKAYASTMASASLSSSVLSSSVQARAAAAATPVTVPARFGSRGYVERKMSEAVVEARKALTNANNPRLQLADYLRTPPTMEQRVQALEQYTTKSILEHSPEDVMSLYEVNKDLIPAPLLPAIARELEFTHGFMLVRQPMVDAVTFLRENGNDISLPFPPSRETGYAPAAKNLAIIYGHRGTGKSTTLAYAAEWARHAGWLVVGTSIDTWARDPLGLIQPSASRPHVFTQPLFSREFLEKFGVENSAILSQIPLQGDYAAWPWAGAQHPMFEPPLTDADARIALPFPAKDSLPRPTAAPATLLDLCALGAWRTDLATEALYAFYWELQHTTAVPVLFAIDNINGMDMLSDFVHPQRVTKLPARRLAGVDALANVIDCPPRRGAVIVATSMRNFPSNNAQEMHDRAGTHVQTKRYSPMELQVMIEHYVVSKATHAEPNLTLLRRTEVATGNVPSDVHDFFKMQ